MTINSYLNKHVFLSGTNPHILNLLLNLIQKEVIKKEETLLVLEEKASYSQDLIEKCISHDIKAMYWNDIKNNAGNFITLNSLSLQPTNASIIVDCLAANYITADKVNILITDDEIDRWLKLYNTLGHIEVNTTALVDKNVLKILEQVNNYIVPYSTWGKPLENILNRKLNIIDAVLPFSVLDYKSQEKLEAFLSIRKKHIDTSECKILLFTKYLDSKKVFNIISSYLNTAKNLTVSNCFTLGIWLPLDKKGMLLYNLLNLMIKLKKIPIKLRIEQPVSTEQYALMLYEYDYLILQERGGFSTAKYFAENVGKLITLKDSFNDKTLTLDYAINTFSSKTYTEAINNAVNSAQVQSNESDDINSFSNLLAKRHNQSFNTLRNYWNSFK